jgi:hypothetical protein
MNWKGFGRKRFWLNCGLLDYDTVQSGSRVPTIRSTASALFTLETTRRPEEKNTTNEADKVTGRACCLVQEFVKCNLKPNAATANFCFGSARLAEYIAVLIRQLLWHIYTACTLNNRLQAFATIQIIGWRCLFFSDGPGNYVASMSLYRQTATQCRAVKCHYTGFGLILPIHILISKLFPRLRLLGCDAM